MDSQPPTLTDPVDEPLRRSDIVGHSWEYRTVNDEYLKDGDCEPTLSENGKAPLC